MRRGDIYLCDFGDPIGHEQGFPVTSSVQCEQIRVVSADRLIRRLAALDAVALIRVETVLRRILVL